MPVGRWIVTTVDGSGILHHPGCTKPYEYWDIYYINWLAGFLNHQQWDRLLRKQWMMATLYISKSHRQFFCFFFGWKTNLEKEILQAHQELRILEIVGWTIHCCRIVSNCIVYTSFSCSAMGFVKRCLWWYTLGLGTWKQKHRKPLVEPPQFAPFKPDSSSVWRMPFSRTSTLRWFTKRRAVWADRFFGQKKKTPDVFF